MPRDPRLSPGRHHEMPQQQQLVPATVTKKEPVTIEAAAPVTAPIETKTTDLAAGAGSLQVKTENDYATASKYKDTAKAILDEIGKTFDSHIAAAYKAHKDLIATKKKFSDPVEAVVRGLNGQMSAFTEQKKRETRLEEARLAEESRKHQETIAASHAAQLELQGHHEAAAQVIEEAIAAPTPVVMMERFNPNDYGRSERTAWKWKITDLKKLNLEMLQVVNGNEISTTGIGALVRGMKNKEQVERMVGGIVAWEETITV